MIPHVSYGGIIRRLQQPTVAEGQEEEEEEEQQHPFQEDHVDVTNLMDLLDRSVTTTPQ